MSYQETLPRIRISRDDMMKRVARFDQLTGFDGGLPDSNMPGCERILYNVIGFQPPAGEGGAVTSPVGEQASRLAAIKIQEGFNLGYCRALPGHGPMLHNHDTNETFMPVAGVWRITWEGDAGNESVELDPLDVISIPPHLHRQFHCLSAPAGKAKGVMLVVIGGDQPAAEFSPEAEAILMARGLMPPAQKRAS